MNSNGSPLELLLAFGICMGVGALATVGLRAYANRLKANAAAEAAAK